MALLKSK